MERIARLIESGEAAENFRGFTLKFNRDLKYVLQKLDGFEELRTSKGHYYLSGFFRVKGQWFYYNLSDVRYWTRDIKLLVRTADHPKDYTGGQNNYVKFYNTEDMLHKLQQLMNTALLIQNLRRY